jgi:hypothetical protein
MLTVRWKRSAEEARVGFGGTAGGASRLRVRRLVRFRRAMLLIGRDADCPVASTLMAYCRGLASILLPPRQPLEAA